MRDFLAYVQCPLFNRREEVIRLCQYLVNISGKPPARAYTAENLFGAAFPVAQFDEKQLRYVMSFTLDNLRAFLSMMEWKADKNEQQRFLLRALNRRELDQLFDQAIEKVEQREALEADGDTMHHFRRYEYSVQKLKRHARFNRAPSVDLQPIPDELTTFYVGEILGHACSALSQQTVTGKTTQFKMLDAILDVVKEGEMLKSPAVAMYYYAYQILRSPDDDVFIPKLRHLAVEHESRFKPSTLNWIFMVLSNGCVQRINLGKKKYMREAFEIYQIAIERGHFIAESGYITSFMYKNIVRVSMAVGEKEWAENFVYKYKIFLHPSEREAIFHYNLAFLHFQNGDYDKAMPLLQMVDSDDPHYNVHNRRMLVRCYYELGELDALESLLQSFTAYLKRQKKLGYHQVMGLNFVRFVTRIVKLPPGDMAAKEALIKDILEEKKINDREWLMEKMGISEVE